jgi:predicted NUDIX family phosphoesterase
MSAKDDRFQGEMVLVIPDATIRKHLGDGFDFFPSKTGMIPAEIASHAKYLKRYIAEEDESYRQLIPYVIIKRTVETKSEFLLFKRLSTQDEKRLHNLFSLGAGGHINPCDDEMENPLITGLHRELREELFLPDNIELVFKGWIYSTIDPVSRVHVGMVFLLNLSQGDAGIRENDKMTSEWCDIGELWTRYDLMEGWSRIIMDNLLEEFIRQ